MPPNERLDWTSADEFIRPERSSLVEVHDVRVPYAKPTVLIVDEDLGFVCWLGEILSQAGYEAVPASDSRSAVALIEELKLRVNLVIVNPALRGAFKMTRLLSRLHPSLKIIAIQNAGTDVVTSIRAQATLERPWDSRPVSRQECIKSIRRVLKSARVAA